MEEAFDAIADRVAPPIIATPALAARAGGNDWLHPTRAYRGDDPVRVIASVSDASSACRSGNQIFGYSRFVLLPWRQRNVEWFTSRVDKRVDLG